MAIDWKGLNPAPVTIFKDNGDVDYDQNAKLAKWLAGIDGVKTLVILGHAGEGTFLTHDEQIELIRVYADAVDVPIVAGITGEGTKVAELEAKEKYDAGARGALVYPNHGWLRFGYQKGAPQTRYQAVAESGLECILFQYPNVTKCTYDLQTQLDIAAIPGVTATKNGVRDMKRWYNEIPVLKNEFPDLAIMSCHDEWLLPTMFDIDGLLVGYGNMAPEALIEYLKAGKAQDYTAARKIHEQLLPVTKAVYHRGSHMEGSVALKHALRARGIIDNVNIREPLKPLGDAADVEIRAAVKASGLPVIKELEAA
ncbi:dihydrodipicolinate synthase family protein [Tropicimonas sp. IMCC6043]|uniref:dihydrodipicolinate synthase family protein n=1 Tax=Tropicimonas sp. IMCC6043 TaxID=2510645 RepID=UPI00101C2416|nr:dihydrodipicolinate synthase family protein [Tropicimonas sp. IMCC6043]RYH08028.1 dihydrodipicolinate synthase family protein [Tropicimonas sp. IMCC6043]